MKSRVVMMALLCLVLVFHGALAATDPAEVSGLTYNGSDQKLLTAGKPDKGFTEYYRLDSGDWSKSIPTGKDAGDYSVDWIQSETEPEDSDTGTTVSVTIDPIEVTLKWTGKDSYTYNGKDQGPTAEVEGLLKNDKNAATVTLENAPETDAGEYTAVASVEFTNDNYVLSDDAVTEKDYTIDPIEVTLKWTVKDSYTYNGEDQGPTAEVEGLLKGDEDVADVSLENAPETDAGEYTAEASVEFSNDNYVLSEKAQTEQDYTIAPVEVTLKWEVEESYTYNGEDQGPTAKVEGLLEGDEDVADVSLENAPETDAGEYTAKASVEFSNDNYVLAEKAQTEQKYTIDPVEVTLKWEVEESYTYNGEEQGPTAEVEGLLEGDEDVADVSLENAPETDAGEYTAKASVEFSNDNYVLAEKAQTEQKYTIAPAEVTLTWEVEDSYTYNGEEQGPTAEVEDIDEETTATVTIIGLGTNAGDYTAKAEVTFDPANYVLAKDAETEQKYTIDPVEVTLTWEVEDSYTYNGEEQGPTAAVEGLLEGDEETASVKISGLGTNAGDYTAAAEVTFDPANYVLAEDAETEQEYTIDKADITEDDFNAPEKIEGLVYNGSDQELITAGSWVDEEMGTFKYNISEYAPKSPEVPTDFSESIPTGDDAGDYTVNYYIEGDENHYDYAGEDEPETLDGEIAQKELDSSMIKISPKKVEYDEKEHEVNVIVKDGRNTLTEGEDYELDESSETTGTDLGEYTVTIKASENTPNYTGEASATWSIIEQLPPYEFQMYQIGDPEEHVSSFCNEETLPATGFPTRIHKPLSVRPAGLNYVDLNMRLQIPTLGIDTELTGVPEAEGSWKVEWLDNRAGLLSGSFVPGDGYSLIAAHNHLNDSQIGPFAMLHELENNDMVFVNRADGKLVRFSVYANELIAPTDMQKLASIAEQEANTLILVTCENESLDGSYLNRRVVFAKPLN